MYSKNHAIIIEGPPLSGKGSVAKRLAEQRYHHVDCGDILRTNRHLLANSAKLMDKGELVPDRIVIDIIFKNLPDHLPENLVITGFPRSIGQAKWLKQHLAADHYRVDVILINATKNSIFARLEKRREEEKREDDNKESLERRLELYSDYGPMVRSFFRGYCGGGVHEIDGNQPREAVWEETRHFVFTKNKQMNGFHRPAYA